LLEKYGWKKTAGNVYIPSKRGKFSKDSEENVARQQEITGHSYKYIQQEIAKNQKIAKTQRENDKITEAYDKARREVLSWQHNQTIRQRNDKKKAAREMARRRRKNHATSQEYVTEKAAQAKQLQEYVTEKAAQAKQQAKQLRKQIKRQALITKKLQRDNAARMKRAREAEARKGSA
jgi:hypothetical protein